MKKKLLFGVKSANHSKLQLKLGVRKLQEATASKSYYFIDYSLSSFTRNSSRPDYSAYWLKIFHRGYKTFHLCFNQFINFYTAFYSICPPLVILTLVALLSIAMNVKDIWRNKDRWRTSRQLSTHVRRSDGARSLPFIIRNLNRNWIKPKVEGTIAFAIKSCIQSILIN